MKIKKTVAATTVFFFALCQKYLRTLALIELYHVGEARVKKLMLGRKIWGDFSPEKSKNLGATTTPLRCRVPKWGKNELET